jgi:DNA polymerase III epsilon subunit-like protein
MVYAAVDVETGGLDHKKNPILSIGCAPLNGGEEFFVQIKADPSTCDAEALRVNKLDPTQGVEPLVALGMFTEWIKRNAIPGQEYKLHCVGQNFGGFDALFLKEFMGASAFRTYISYRYGDTQAVGMALIDAGIIDAISPKLDHLLNSYAIRNDKPHDALEDARAEAKLWNAMIKTLRNLHACEEFASNHRCGEA